MHRRVVIGLVVVAVVVLVGGGGLFAWQAMKKTSYEQAVAWMPSSTLRATYTDWSQVRELAGGTSLDAASSAHDVDDFLSRAYEQDLTSTSAVTDSTYAMADRYGFSPLDAQWEMYGQSREGAVAVLELTDAVDLDGVERNLRTLGYDAPEDGAGSGQVWKGSADLVAQIDPSLTPVLQNVVVLPEQEVVLLSDSAAYASSAADVVQGSDPGLAEETDGVDDLAGLLEDPVSSVLFASDFACEALSMSSADEENQAVTDNLVAKAGGVNPLSGLVLASDADRSLTVGMYFESSDQAEANLQPRVDLAAGEAVGQGGMFADRFRIESAEQQGKTVVLELSPKAEESLLSDLSQGPVIFATC